jgi:hypothetical protein
MTFKAMSAMLALLPGFAGAISTPCTAGTIDAPSVASASIHPAENPATADTSDPAADALHVEGTPLRHELLSWRVLTHHDQASSTVAFGTAHSEHVCSDAACQRDADWQRPALRTSVPKPRTLVLFGMGLLLFGLRRRDQ